MGAFSRPPYNMRAALLGRFVRPLRTPLVGGLLRRQAAALSSLSAKAQGASAPPPSAPFWWPHLDEMSHRPAIVTPPSLSWLHNEVDDDQSLTALLNEIEQADFEASLKLTSIDGACSASLDFSSSCTPRVCRHGRRHELIFCSVLCRLQRTTPSFVRPCFLASSRAGISLEFDLPSAEPSVEEVRAPEAVPVQAPVPMPESETIIAMPKRPYQPNRLKRKRTHGFLRRMKTPGGRKTLERRRRHGRWKVAVT